MYGTYCAGSDKNRISLFRFSGHRLAGRMWPYWTPREEGEIDRCVPLCHIRVANSSNRIYCTVTYQSLVSKLVIVAWLCCGFCMILPFGGYFLVMSMLYLLHRPGAGGGFSFHRDIMDGGSTQVGPYTCCHLLRTVQYARLMH